MKKEDYKKVQIAQLEKNIKIIQDILDFKIENYTHQPIGVLRDALATCQQKLNILLKEENNTDSPKLPK